jgi:hypothetical protein
MWCGTRAKHPWRGEAGVTLGGRTWQDLAVARPRIGRHWVGERADRWGPRISEGEREGTEDGRRESNRKAYSGEYTKGWADWADEGRRPVEEAGRHGERGERERSAASWAKRLNGRLG